MKTYRLKWYHPFWINNDEIINYYHISKLLKDFVAIPNPWEEIKINNYNWTDILYLECYHNINDNIDYIKIEQNNQNYYYRLIKKDEIGVIDKNGNLIVKYYFELDEWNTYIHELTMLLIIWKCVVHFKQAFLDRLLRLNNKYLLNYTLQKYLKDIVPLPNITNKREYVNGTNGNKIYLLNEPMYYINDLPTEYQLHNWATNAVWNFNVKEWFGSDINMNGDNHRYCYLIAKSSAMRKIDNNQKNLSTNTSQKIIIIPLVPSHKDEILHAINDIGITIEQNGCLVIGNDNTISSKLTEAIPYAVLFDWYLKNIDKVEFKYAINKIDNDSSHDIKIPFFLINFNQPILLKIFDYLNTSTNQGIGVKIRNFINNLDKLLPTTEPLMFNPHYYYEMYNNGLTQYSISFEDLNLEFDKSDNKKLKSLENITLQAYFNFFSGIDMSFYFGNLTNIYNPSLDNTNTRTVDIGIPFGLSSGASARFLENDLTSGYTGLLNRQNEKGQRIADATFDSAILALDIVGNATSSTGWLNPGKTGTAIAKDVVKIGKVITDTVMTEQRADNSFYSSIKNTIQAPNNITTTPYSKASIPLPDIDSNHLMNMYAILPVQQCLDKIFINYLHEGYVYDSIDSIDKCINRKFMNILFIAANDTKEDILNIWEREYSNNVFKNKFWFTRALTFLSTKHKMYMTSFLVNCTNHNGNAYVHNIEIEPYYIETIKINIDSLITNYLDVAPKYINEIKNLLVLKNPNLLEYQNDIEIQCNFENGYIVINAKENTNLMGQVVFNTFFYTAKISYEDNTHYYINSLNDLCSPFNITNNTPYETWEIAAYKENNGIVSLRLGNTGNDFSLEIIPNIENTLNMNLNDFLIKKGFCVWCKIKGDIIIPNWYNNYYGHLRFDDYAFFNTKNNIKIILNTEYTNTFRTNGNQQFTFTKNYIPYQAFTTTIICKTQAQLDYCESNFPILPNQTFTDFHRNILIELEND